MEPSTTQIILPVVISIFLLIVGYVFHSSKMRMNKHKYDHLLSDYLKASKDLERTHKYSEEYKSDIILLEKRLVEMEANLKHIKEQHQIALHNEVRQEEKFQNIANKILQNQTITFDQIQTKGIKEILQPLQEKIKNFEAKIENSNHESIKRHVSLKEQISFLTKQSQQVSQEANNLAKALKGDFKKQGNWGEMILEMILEKSGLQKDREYFIQTSLKDDDGRTQRPDVVIHLPNQKRLIIDSKVSLVDYNAMVNSDCLEDVEFHQKRHAAAIRRHIEQLSDKNYHNLYKIESPDFVLMFIPIDTACSAALAYDPKLYEYGFRKNIIIVAPTTLLATLKTVETLWQNDKQNRYALQIADEAGKMFDKFVGFTEDMDKMGNQLNTVQKTYQLSMSKLSQGNGNLVQKAEKIKALGAKANKSIPEALLVETLA